MATRKRRPRPISPRGALKTKAAPVEQSVSAQLAQERKAKAPRVGPTVIAEVARIARARRVGPEQAPRITNAQAFKARWVDAVRAIDELRARRGCIGPGGRHRHKKPWNYEEL